MPILTACLHPGPLHNVARHAFCFRITELEKQRAALEEQREALEEQRAALEDKHEQAETQKAEVEKKLLQLKQVSVKPISGTPQCLYIVLTIFACSVCVVGLGDRGTDTRS